MITFVFFTKNEEKRISYAIKNVSDFGDVILLDGGSTDRTQQIAEALGARFYTRPDTTSTNVETQTNLDFIKTVAKTDWIYWGYVDNIAPLELLNEMTRLVKSGKYKKINLPMKTFLWGITDQPIQRSYGPFLFHTSYIDFTNNYIHGFGKFLGRPDEVYSIPHFDDLTLCHFSSYDLGKFVPGHLRYALTEAEEKYKRGEKFSLLKTLAAMIRYVYIYGRHGWRYGKLGVLICLNYANFRLMVYTKLYELEHDINLDSIEFNYSQAKQKMLSRQNK